jgi:tricarballylate dehydrogenase
MAQSVFKTKVPTMSDDQHILSRHYDVLIAGGGNAALCAATTAARAGASVLIVEAAPKAMRGGNSRHTRNMRVAHDAGNGILTGPYPVKEYWDDLWRVTGGQTDEQLARLTLDRSQGLWDWHQQQGVRFQPSLSGTLSLGRTNAFFLGGGKALLNVLYLTATSLGVGVVYDAKVIELNITDGVFRSAVAQKGGVDYQITASNFVAAAGGFEANLDWLSEYWGEAAQNFLVRGTPYNRGDILRLLLHNRAQPVGDPKQCHAVAIDGRAPKFDGGIVTRLDCVPFGIVVNKQAERFYDEGEDFWPKRYAIWGRLVAMQPDQLAFAIVDATSVDLFMPSVYPPEQSETIEGLAKKLTLDPARLRATVDAFNAACRSGTFNHTIHDHCSTEGLTPPKSHWARPLFTPPFYGYPLRPGITFTYLGVKVDAEARIIMSNGSTSPNMFAAGEIMAGNVLGKGYLAGIGMTIGSVFGRIAGHGAARHARH